MADGSNEMLRHSLSVDTSDKAVWLLAQGIAPSASVLDFSIVDS